jgi:hypothetical protein
VIKELTVCGEAQFWKFDPFGQFALKWQRLFRTKPSHSHIVVSCEFEHNHVVSCRMVSGGVRGMWKKATATDFE